MFEGDSADTCGRKFPLMLTAHMSGGEGNKIVTIFWSIFSPFQVILSTFSGGFRPKKLKNPNFEIALTDNSCLLSLSHIFDNSSDFQICYKNCHTDLMKKMITFFIMTHGNEILLWVMWLASSRLRLMHKNHWSKFIKIILFLDTSWHLVDLEIASR